MSMWTTNNKTVFLQHIEADARYAKDSNGVANFAAGYVLQFPSLLFACIESGNFIYDSLLSFRSNEPVPRGEDVQMFLRDSYSQPNNYHVPQVYGWIIQDFRYAGLARRVKEEKERLEEMREELELVPQQRVVDVQGRSEGYVRLPLFDGGPSIKDSNGRTVKLYPSALDIDCRLNRL